MSKCPLFVKITKYRFLFFLCREVIEPPECLREECAWWMTRSLPVYDPENRNYTGERDNSGCAMVVVADRMKRM